MVSFFCELRTADPAGWPSDNPQGDARYKWFFDVSGNDGDLQGGNINNAEYMLAIEDPDDGDNDGVGEISLYDSSFSLIAGPELGSGSVVPSGPQEAYTNNFGYKIQGNNVDMYIRMSTLGNPTAFNVFWSTDQENPLLKQAPECDRPDSGNFINLVTLTTTGAGTGNDTITGPGISCTSTAGVISGDCSEIFGAELSVTLTGTPTGDSTFDGWSGDCNSSGQVTMDGNKTCTATFNTQPGTLNIVKVLNSNNGGTNDVTQFSYQIDGGTATPFEPDGQNSETVASGSHSVTEVAAPGYTTTYSGDCDNNGNVTVPAGSSATCTIKNWRVPLFWDTLSHSLTGT